MIIAIMSIIFGEMAFGKVCRNQMNHFNLHHLVILFIFISIYSSFSVSKGRKVNNNQNSNKINLYGVMTRPCLRTFATSPPRH
jgi:hypothetical protein